MRGHLAAELGVPAFERGYASWSEGDRSDEAPAPHTAAAVQVQVQVQVQELVAASAAFTRAEPPC